MPTAPGRLYLVASNELRPFQSEDYLVTGITIAERDAALAFDGEFEAGGLDRESYVSPWTVLAIRGDHVSKGVAVASNTVVTETASSIANSLEPE